MAAKLAEMKDKAEQSEAAEPGKPASKTAVKKLSTGVQSIDKRMSTLRGEKGALIKTASADDNVDKQAFSQAMKELNMDPERRAEFQRNLGLYRAHLGIELQGDLLKDTAKQR